MYLQYFYDGSEMYGSLSEGKSQQPLSDGRDVLGGH